MKHEHGSKFPSFYPKVTLNVQFFHISFFTLQYVMKLFPYQDLKMILIHSQVL